MNLDKNLIGHWAALFESEDSKKNGTYIVCEEFNGEIENIDGTAVNDQENGNSDTPADGNISESNAGKEIIDAFTNILKSGLPSQELEKMLVSLETLKGKDDVINQTELERLITMYQREIGGV